jgi:small-conductance mechanosensitive channel
MNKFCQKLILLVFWLLSATVQPCVPLAAETPPAAPADVEIATAPVEIDGQVLFSVRNAWTYPAVLRAKIIRERIEAAAADPTIEARALHVVTTGPYAAIMAGDRILMGVSEDDAQLARSTRQELAAAHVEKIRTAIGNYRQARSSEALAESYGKTAVAILGLCLALLALLRVWRYVDTRIGERTERFARTLEERSLQEMRADRIGRYLRLGWRLLGMVCILAVLATFAGYLLEQFPATRPIGIRFFSLLMEPLRIMGTNFVAEVPSLLFLAVLFLLVRFTLRGLRLLSEAVAQGAVTFIGFEPEWARPTYNLARLAIVFFALVVAYPYIPGSDSDAFKGISIFFGVMFSLGSSSAVSNAIAGYMILYRRAFKVGDRVKIGSSLGDVMDMHVHVTRLKTLKNEEVIIPNSQILNSEVVNYSSLAAKDGLILHTTVGIGYEVPWRQVEAMLHEAAKRTQGLLKCPAPFVLQKNLADFAVNYELNVSCNDASAMNRLYSELHRNIQDVFNEYGVQIMTPAYEADPETPKIVPRDQWFASPAAAP